ncbi:MAG TPA: Flp family type IVb pilin [Syntrophus sp. (in: bacteria)]|nr:Flp family type IVb pilin [Syntrophus sp. (in: bacteria)]
MGTRTESGQALVEYALIIAFIAVVCIGAVTLFGQTIRDSLFTPVLGGF